MDALTGGYCQSDPMASSTWDSYGYAASNPIWFIDILGLSKATEDIQVAAAVTAIWCAVSGTCTNPVAGGGVTSGGAPGGSGPGGGHGGGLDGYYCSNDALQKFLQIMGQAAACFSPAKLTSGLCTSCIDGVLAQMAPFCSGCPSLYDCEGPKQEWYQACGASFSWGEPSVTQGQTRQSAAPILQSTPWFQ